jgi:uncharacterized protein (TIGR00295 family)
VIPDESQSLGIHKKYGSNQILLGHCRTVAMVAEIVASEFNRKGISVDLKAIRAAALLHDIGRNRTHAVQHGYVGAEIVEREGVDRKVGEIIRKHVGAGISREEAQSLGFPEGDFVPRTLEEKIVCFADKMVDADSVRPFEKEVERFRRKGHDVPRLEKLKSDISSELGEDPEKLVLAKVKERSIEGRS